MVSYRRVASAATLMLIAGLAACGRDVLPTPIATARVVATARPAATATTAPARTAPPVPATPAPTRTATPAPHSPTLQPAGPDQTPSSTPEPTATVTPDLPTLVVTDTPEPENIITVAAQAMIATRQAATTGTPTPLRARLVTATAPFVITATETPANAATASYLSQYATAEVFLFGTPTPLPAHAVTATPEPTETPGPLLLYLVDLTPSPVPTLTLTPTPTPTDLPAEVKGKILFLTDRFKKKAKDPPTVLVMDPDGSNVAIVTDDWVYDRAEELNRTSPGGLQTLFVQQDSLWVENYDGWRQFFFDLGGTEYDPAWAPDSAHVAFVSDLSGNDEILVYNKDTGEVKQLTVNEWQWDKHPSFSPDGKKIVFWSNRVTGRMQIWVMNSDGSNPVNLSNSPHGDWNPVWVK